MPSNKTLKNQGAIGAAKTKVILHRNVNGHVSCRIGAVIQIALRVWGCQIDGGGTLLMMQGQDSENTLDAARTTEQMPGHGLG